MAELKTRILVVDDDQRLRDLLTRYLGEQKFEVRAVRDAPEMDKHLARERMRDDRREFRGERMERKDGERGRFSREERDKLRQDLLDANREMKGKR